MRGVIAIVILAANTAFAAVIYKDFEFEAVIIDESPDAPKLHELELVSEDSEEVNDSDPDKCEEGNIKGKCSSLQTCYPFLKYVDETDLIKTGLLNIIKNGTRPCSSGSNKICCGERTIPFARIRSKLSGDQAKEKFLNKETDDFHTCGNAPVAFDKVYGGRPAVKNEFPYATALLKNNQQFCTGSLLSSRWILTTAHCVSDIYDLSMLSVNVGEYDLSSPHDHFNSGIDKIVYHSGFKMRNMANDIALLHLKETVPFSETIQPICLNRKNVTLDQQMFLIGWGQPVEGEVSPSTLQIIKLRTLSEEKCKNKFTSEGISPPSLSSGMLCVGPSVADNPNFTESCVGDSGSPLSIYEDKAIQVGFISTGIGCGKKPGIYTNVNHYVNWIEKNMQT